MPKVSWGHRGGLLSGGVISCKRVCLPLFWCCLLSPHLLPQIHKQVTDTSVWREVPWLRKRLWKGLGPLCWESPFCEEMLCRWVMVWACSLCPRTTSLPFPSPPLSPATFGLSSHYYDIFFFCGRWKLNVLLKKNVGGEVPTSITWRMVGCTWELREVFSEEIGHTWPLSKEFWAVLRFLKCLLVPNCRWAVWETICPVLFQETAKTAVRGSSRCFMEGYLPASMPGLVLNLLDLDNLTRHLFQLLGRFMWSSFPIFCGNFYSENFKRYVSHI